MNDILNKTTVLVLNRNWQAIHVKTPAQAFCMMATDAATALDIEDNGGMRPVKWAEWLALPVREGDNCVQTVHGPVRAPTVLVLANYARVPKRRPKFSAKNIWQRDGATCQYTFLLEVLPDLHLPKIGNPPSTRLPSDLRRSCWHCSFSSVSPLRQRPRPR
jgi:hypothetical protein